MRDGSDPAHLDVLNLLNIDIERFARWLLRRSGGAIDVARTVTQFAAVIERIFTSGANLVSDGRSGEYEAEVQRLTALGFGAQACLALACCRTTPAAWTSSTSQSAPKIRSKR